MIHTIWAKYRVEFGALDGLKGAYLGDTIKEVHEAIDSDNRLSDWLRDVLKYGYFGEFKDKPYETKDYVIDNIIHFIWYVKEKSNA